MLSVASAREKAEKLVEQARAAGADAADAVYVGERSSGVQVRKGALEDVHRSEGEEMGLRVFVGSKSASVASSDLSDEALSALVGRVIAMAGEAPEDPYAGLAPAELLLCGELADLDNWDAIEPDPAALKARALEAESAALAVAGVTNSNGGSASASASTFALATSGGFSGGTRASGHSCSVSVVAGEGSGMQRDYGWHSARHAEDLEDADAIGRRAAERAVARLGNTKIVPGKYPVLFEPRVAGTLLGHFSGAITGSSIARKTSFLQDRLGEQVFAKGVTIHDDPFRKRGIRSRAFDGEGLPVRAMNIVADGVLTTWLATSADARQLGIQPTGHAVRGVSGAPGAGPSNFYLAAGERSREELVAAFPRCILVTELIGQGVNPVTGDYSRGAAGFLIENGEIAGPVAEITIASNLKDMFLTLEPGSDLRFRRGVDAPTVLVPEMTVASA
ncbi:TldD/PmbA family protein [Sphingomonas alba]|uniref:Metallopeptidase TldD-related protein n=1 Tax=Sphingomonas alba TaxID=2908208 RepID=A0ABT0RLE9_9SPHN|nr:metallopeptidase TldD-related protein [Sphingomonas alba]MCL6683420.1 metallopeptidase TldD-related protein [Sphingomonas alba]